jgi:hypothetical protein
MDGLDSLFGGNFSELLQKQKDNGFTNVSDQYTMVQGLASSGPSTSDTSSKKARLSEAEPHAPTAGPTQEDLLRLQTQFEEEKKQKELCEARIIDLTNQIADLELKLDAATGPPLMETDEATKAKVTSYDNSVLSATEDELVKLIDRLDSVTAPTLKEGLNMAAKDDTTGVPSEARDDLKKLASDSVNKVRMRLMLKPKAIIVFVMSHLVTAGHAFTLAPVFPSKSSRQQFNIEAHFSEFHKTRASGASAGLRYKCFKHIQTGKVLYSRNECAKFIASQTKPLPLASSSVCLPPATAMPPPLPPPILAKDPKPSPAIKRLAESLFIDCTGPEMAKYQTSASLILAAPDTLSPALLNLRTRAIHSESRVSRFRPPVPIPLQVPIAVSPAPEEADGELAKFWPYLQKVSSSAARGEPSWIQHIAGGSRLHSRTEPEQLRRAVSRMLSLLSSKALARVRCALDFVQTWHDEQNIRLEWPVPPAYWSNMATDKMEASAKWLQGEGLSIAPKFLEVIAQATKNLRLPSGIRSCNDSIEPVTKVPRYQPTETKEACFAPLFLWDKCQQLAACELPSPLGVWFMACNMDIMISGSARSVEHIRTSVSSTFDLGRDVTLFSISQSKSRKEKNAKFALRNVGLRKRRLHHLTPGSKFLNMFTSYGPSPIMLDVNGKRTEDIETAVSFVARPDASDSTLQGSFDKRGRQLYSYCGYDIPAQKRMRLTMHSPHSTCDNVGQELHWPSDVCGTKTYPKQGRLGRWAEGMAGGYASEPAARDQLRLRSAVVDSINSLYPHGDFPFEPTMACLTASPDYMYSQYYGRNFML